MKCHSASYDRTVQLLLSEMKKTLAKTVVLATAQ